MPCYLSDAKPLSEPMLAYSQLDPEEEAEESLLEIFYVVQYLMCLSFAFCLCVFPLIAPVA